VKPEEFQRLGGIIRQGVDDRLAGAVLWVGAGLSIPAGYPSWNQLATKIRSYSITPISADLSGPELIDNFVLQNGKGRLADALAQILRPATPLAFHLDLVRLPWRCIVTTNYDELLEDACKKAEVDFLTVTLEQNLDVLAPDRLSIIKPHGSLADYRRVVLDSDSYAEYDERYPLAKADLESQLRKHSIVFFGCSMTDPRLIDWLKKLGQEGRRYLKPSATVMTRDGWARAKETAGSLLAEANIIPVIIERYEDLPELIRNLLELIPLPSKRCVVDLTRIEGSRCRVSVNGQAPEERDLPWKIDGEFSVALWTFWRVSRQAHCLAGAAETVGEAAARIGACLSAFLFGSNEKILKDLLEAAGTPLLLISAEDNFLLSLPWELLRLDGKFIVKEALLDIARTVPSGGGAPERPDRPFRLLVHISAPEGSGLNYEAEHYRILRELHDSSLLDVTELGTVEDLVEAVRVKNVTGVHFSGHGHVRSLQFEDEDGGAVEVSIGDLLARMRAATSNNLPGFFYLAHCYGNDPVGESDLPSAAELHKAGIANVVGYYGPILDEFSTRAEVAIYRAIAAGHTLRYGVRQARLRLSEPVREGRAESSNLNDISQPFAWAQIVLYEKGHDVPLSTPVTTGDIRKAEAQLERTFRDAGTRRELSAGFIGRRRERHFMRRLVRQGQRTFVIQGLGGLGKSALALQLLTMLSYSSAPPLVLWCQEIRLEDPLADLHEQVHRYAAEVVGAKWKSLAETLDRQSPDLQGVTWFIQLVKRVASEIAGLVVYLDNLESLLVGPSNGDADAFGEWRNERLKCFWKELCSLAEQNVIVLIATCRYRNPDFQRVLLPLQELSHDAVFRLMGWYPNLRRLSGKTRARLVDNVHGHPRAVGYLEDLTSVALAHHEDRYGRWQGWSQDQEWDEIVAPMLAGVSQRLREDVLFDAIWDNVLDVRSRRMLCRMTILVRPWDWDLMQVLGEADDESNQAERTADLLRSTSLLEQAEERRFGGWRRLYQLHPMTTEFTLERSGSEAEMLRSAAYFTVGTYLEGLALLGDIEVVLDAASYLFKANETERAFRLAWPASVKLGKEGRLRDGLLALEPFLDSSCHNRLSAESVGFLHNAVGGALAALGRNREAIVHFQKSLDILEKADDRYASSLLAELAVAYTNLGDREKALELLQRGLSIARASGDPQQVAHCLTHLGTLHSALGKARKACEFFSQVLAMSEQCDVRASLKGLADAKCDLGHIEESLPLYRNLIKICSEVRDRYLEGSSYGALGAALGQLGRLPEAWAALQQGLRIAEADADLVLEQGTLTNLGGLCRRQGNPREALEYYERALKIACQIEYFADQGMILANMGNAKSDLKEFEGAIALLKRAVEIAEQTGDRRGLGPRLGNMGSAMAKKGDFQGAIPLLKQAVQLGLETGQMWAAATFSLNLGMVYEQLGQITEATGSYEQAVTLAEQSDSLTTVLELATQALNRLTGRTLD
jgi:tetratricopeptide (TPR) repeat protein